MTDAHDLELVIRSRVPLIVFESFEERRALDMITRAAMQQRLSMFCWSVTEGLNRLGFGGSPAGGEELCEPDAVLAAIKEHQDAGIYVLCDIHPYLNQPKIVRLLKDIAINHERIPHTIILLSYAVDCPPELNRYIARFNLALPNEDQLRSIVRDEARAWSNANNGHRVKSDNATLEKVVNSLKGTSFSDAQRLVRGAIYNDGALTENDIPTINRAKFELLDMEGVLSFEFNTEEFGNVGGLHNLKAWLEKRRGIFLDEEKKIEDCPKGMLLLGIQGSGKSLAAKAVAGMWGLPLLRLDFATLYNKFIGETEKNLREALAQADTMAPCVLWIDEIEKGIATNDIEGTSRRLLGTLLTWMAERSSRVFVVATANEIRGLPPELLRKGRIDEIFFVDLPDDDTRAHIFEIHLQRRDCDSTGFDLSQLAQAAEGFSGAEIEQAVVSAIYQAAARREPLTQQHVLNEIFNTAPLSTVMAEDIAALRLWAEQRTVMA